VNALVLYDDERARLFEPFALTRPLAEMRAGAELIRRRWARALATDVSGLLVAEHLADFEELDAPPAVTDGALRAGTVVANSRCVVALADVERGGAVWRCGDQVAAVRLAHDTPASAFVDGSLALERVAPASGPIVDVAGRWLVHVWDFIRDLNTQLSEDIAALVPTVAGASLPAGVTVFGAHPVCIEAGATVEPYVVFDASAGPVLVRRGAAVQAFTRVAGPCFVGEGSTIMTDRIAASSIGDACRIHGEISMSVVLGHANKAHDGFVGHSYLGRWVNLGAGTITSNLKNTYGTVALWTPTGLQDTGMQFLGALIGDHAKTGIGTRLTTGSVLGAGANVFGGAMPPKAVPPFAWGDGAPYATYALDKFLTVAGRAMLRRQVTLGARGRRQLAAAHARRWQAGR
jgi:UDP-N-acetylglucosamine diphosphorylase/glucosamine-1-phosphate N-acetyltransferase